MSWIGAILGGTAGYLAGRTYSRHVQRSQPLSLAGDPATPPAPLMWLDRCPPEAQGELNRINSELHSRLAPLPFVSAATGAILGWLATSSD